MDHTDALNLWDIEVRIKKLHEELDILHQTKEELLRKNKVLVCNTSFEFMDDNYTSDTLR